MAENMPPLSLVCQNALAFSRARVLAESNKTRLYQKAALMPSIEDIHSMDVRLQVFFVEQLCRQMLEDAMANPDLTRAEKIRACRDALDLETRVWEHLEGNSMEEHCEGKGGVRRSK